MRGGSIRKNAEGKASPGSPSCQSQFPRISMPGMDILNSPPLPIEVGKKIETGLFLSYEHHILA
jgi:hypothetical protein